MTPETPREGREQRNEYRLGVCPHGIYRDTRCFNCDPETPREAGRQETTSPGGGDPAQSGATGATSNDPTPEGVAIAAAAPAGLPAADPLRAKVGSWVRHHMACPRADHSVDFWVTVEAFGVWLSETAAADRAERGLPLALDTSVMTKALEALWPLMDRGGFYDPEEGGRAVAAEYARLAADPQSPTGEGEG